LLDDIENREMSSQQNSDSTINIEYLIEDCDLNQHLVIEQFKELISPVVARVKQTLQRILEKDIPLHIVEIVEGATKIPIIRELSWRCSKWRAFHRHSTSQCIARSCAIQIQKPNLENDKKDERYARR